MSSTLSDCTSFFRKRFKEDGEVVVGEGAAADDDDDDDDDEDGEEEVMMLVKEPTSSVKASPASSSIDLRATSTVDSSTVTFMRCAGDGALGVEETSSPSRAGRHQKSYQYNMVGSVCACACSRVRMKLNRGNMTSASNRAL